VDVPVVAVAADEAAADDEIVGSLAHLHPVAAGDVDLDAIDATGAVVPGVEAVPTDALVGDRDLDQVEIHRLGVTRTVERVIDEGDAPGRTGVRGKQRHQDKR